VVKAKTAVEEAFHQGDQVTFWQTIIGSPAPTKRDSGVVLKVLAKRSACLIRSRDLDAPMVVGAAFIAVTAARSGPLPTARACVCSHSEMSHDLKCMTCYCPGFAAKRARGQARSYASRRPV
jgi:hypothetical protein